MFRLGPAVGVVNPTAAGTAEDPYVIEGWCITPPVPSLLETELEGLVESAGIVIEDTTAHVVVRDSVVDGFLVDVPIVAWERQVDGIRLTDADNVTVHNNTIAHNGQHGVSLAGSDTATVDNNTITNNADDGILLDDSHGAAIHDNTLKDNQFGVLVSDGNDVDIRGNIAGDNVVGIHFLRVTGATVHDNTLTTNDVSLASSDGATIHDNVLRDDSGVSLWGSDGVAIHNNTVRQTASDGLSISVSDDATVQNNTIRDSDIGLDLFQADGATVRHNNITESRRIGLAVEDSRSVDATNNWWGAASGPSGSVEDYCTGTIADGDGDSIVTFGRSHELCFDPWLESPNPEAGAD